MNEQPEVPAIAVRDGERWTRVLTLDGDGPYLALVHVDAQRGLVALLPRQAVEAMTHDCDPVYDIYGGLRWSGYDPQTLLIYADADDTDPRLVGPDERGLYDLDIDWVEEVAAAVPTVAEPSTGPRGWWLARAGVCLAAPYLAAIAPTLALAIVAQWWLLTPSAERLSVPIGLPSAWSAALAQAMAAVGLTAVGVALAALAIRLTNPWVAALTREAGALLGQAQAAPAGGPARPDGAGDAERPALPVLDSAAGEQLVAAADHAATALSTLLDAWEQAARQSSDLDELLAQGYPFGADLYEVVAQARQWADTVPTIVNVCLPAEHWGERRRDLTRIGAAAVWRYPAASDVPADLSDHYWLSVLGASVLVHRRPDGVFVAVDNEAIDPAHGPLLVQVNQGDSVQYGEDHRPD